MLRNLVLAELLQSRRTSGIQCLLGGRVVGYHDGINETMKQIIARQGCPRALYSRDDAQTHKGQAKPKNCFEHEAGPAKQNRRVIGTVVMERSSLSPFLGSRNYLGMTGCQPTGCTMADVS